MHDLLVIGGASLDLLHFKGQSVRAAGGAGMYTAAAANRTGARVAMYAPHPHPMPEALQPAEERIHWFGMNVTPDELPHFEIAHYGKGKAELLNASWGKEFALDPQKLPQDLSSYEFIHIAAVGSAEHQLTFLKVCRQRRARRISLGTFAHVVYAETATVRELFELADVFFMNENEAVGLFGSVEQAVTQPGKLLFVTLGDRGALVTQGDYRTHVPSMEVDDLDPTGAGDTFCGATLAGLVRGVHPVMAARAAAPLAADMITAVGPQALWESGELPTLPIDPRVTLDHEQIARVASLITTLGDIEAFNFTGPGLPETGDPAALDYFFAATLQQFGFWEIADGRYKAPMIATIEGETLKGSDYLWRAYMRKLRDGNSDFFRPEAQAQLTKGEMLNIFRSVEGHDPMPALDLHIDQARSYGKDMLALNCTPWNLVEQANASSNPLRTFFSSLDHVGGYKDDPLRKKAALLALILSGRPERILQLQPEDSIPPIIDYHLMRSCLRTGLLDLVDSDLKQRIQDRALLEPEQEWAVRRAAYEAVLRVAQISQKNMGAIDWFFFNARRRCPEMTDPQCDRCPVGPVCLKRKTLFQPVIRTTFY